MNRIALGLALVLGLSFAVYAPVLRHGFTHDDAFYAKAQLPDGPPNTMVAELHPITEYFQRPMNHGVSYCRGFRPVTVYSYALVHRLSRRSISQGVLGEKWSDPAWTQHLLNLCAHLAATALVFFMVRRFAPDAAALCAALVFGVHALHTEAIVWIVGRAELLSFCFGAGATLLGAAALDRRGAGRAGRLFGAALLLFLACCSKESGVVWTCFAPLFGLALWFHRRPDEKLAAFLRRQSAGWTAACGVPLLLFLWLRQRMIDLHFDSPFQVAVEANPLFELGVLERLPSAVMLLAYGLGKVMLPLELCTSYGSQAFDLPVGWLAPSFLASLALLGSLAYLAFRNATRHPLLLMAAGAFFGLSFVSSNLPVPIETVFAERTYYAASLGLSFLLAWIVSRWPGERSLRTVVAVPLGLWVLLSLRTSVERTFEWRTNDSLYVADLEKQPRSILMHWNVSTIRFRKSDHAGGNALLRKALKIDPDEPGTLYRMAQRRLQAGVAAKRAGQAELERQRLAETDDLIKRALSSPQFRTLLHGRDLHTLRSQLCRLLERKDEGHAELRMALEDDPWSVLTRLRLVERAREDGDGEAVQSLLTEGETLVPDSPFWGMVRGSLAHAAQDHQSAVTLFGGSLPNLPLSQSVLETWAEYAVSLAAVGRTSDCREVARHFLEGVLPPDVRTRLLELLAGD